jgi:glucokinase
MNPGIAIGVDIGGSHIICAAIDLATHSLISGTHSERKINNKASAEEILTGWSEAISDTIGKTNKELITGIGFAMPGPFNYSEGIALFERVEKYEGLFGLNITNELRLKLNLNNNIRFRYINDATSFAIAEAWIGKVSKYDRILALTLGTGFGSAFLENDIPVLEGSTVPEYGCAWHIPFKDGIADDYFSTRWFINRYFDMSGVKVSGVKEIAEIAENDAFARSLFEEYGTNMGIFLAPWLKRFGAEVIIIGGNITGSFHLFGNHLTNALSENGAISEVYISELKEDAAIIGSARLMVEDYWLKVNGLLSKM